MANTLKWNRVYELYIIPPDEIPLTIKLPFTVEFDITRNELTSANVCQIRVYGLTPNNRDRLRFNVTNYAGPYYPISFKAGYPGNVAEVFTGNVQHAWTTREGNNYVTTLECYDGGFAFVNGRSNQTFPKGTPMQAVYSGLISDLPNVSPGAISDLGNPPLTRAATYSGNTAQILSDITGANKFFVDNGKGYVLDDNEYLATLSPTLNINADTGILGTPVIEQTIAYVDMLFEPPLSIGTVVNLTSITDKFFNKNYKVTAIKHRGTISAAVAGKAVTTAQFYWNKDLNPIPQIGGG